MIYGDTVFFPDCLIEFSNSLMQVIPIEWKATEKVADLAGFPASEEVAVVGCPPVVHAYRFVAVDRNGTAEVARFFNICADGEEVVK